MIRKKVMAGGIVALAAVLGGGGIFAWTHRTADMETLADNQKYVYAYVLSLIHISEPTRQAEISYAVFCLKKKKQQTKKKHINYHLISDETTH